LTRQRPGTGREAGGPTGQRSFLVGDGTLSPRPPPAKKSRTAGRKPAAGTSMSRTASTGRWTARTECMDLRRAAGGPAVAITAYRSCCSDAQSIEQRPPCERRRAGASSGSHCCISASSCQGGIDDQKSRAVEATRASRGWSHSSRGERGRREPAPGVSARAPAGPRLDRIPTTAIKCVRQALQRASMPGHGAHQVVALFLRRADR